jgi:hypothetical protein
MVLRSPRCWRHRRPLPRKTVVSLSPEAKEKLLEAAASRPPKMIGEPAINGLDRGVHGEVGMFVGTGGSRRRVRIGGRAGRSRTGRSRSPSRIAASDAERVVPSVACRRAAC